MDPWSHTDCSIEAGLNNGKGGVPLLVQCLMVQLSVGDAISIGIRVHLGLGGERQVERVSLQCGMCAYNPHISNTHCQCGCTHTHAVSHFTHRLQYPLMQSHKSP